LWKKETNLKNAKKVVEEYEKEERRKKDKQKKMPKRFMANLLYRWDNRKFDREYLKKLERN